MSAEPSAPYQRPLLRGGGRPCGAWRLARAAALGALLAFSGAVAQASPASGSGRASRKPVTERRARALYAEAERHFAQRQYGQAIELYAAAYELQPLPGFLFNIAQCHRMLGAFGQAVAFFERYMGRYPDSPHRAQIERLLAELRPQALRQRAARRVETGAARRDREGVMPGARGPGGAAAVARSGSQAGPGPGEQRGELAAVSGTADVDTLATRGRSVLLWSGIGLTAALLTAGLLTGQLASNKVEQHNDSETPAADRPKLKDSAEALRMGSIVTLSAAGATALATGLYYWLGGASEASTRSSGPAPAAVSAAPLIGGGGAVLIHGRY